AATGGASHASACLDRSKRARHSHRLLQQNHQPRTAPGLSRCPVAVGRPVCRGRGCLAPAPGPSVQLAIAEFMREGHYMRHLRRAKRLYSAQRDALLKCLRPRATDSVVGGLAVVLRLPDGAPDVSIAKETLTFGLAPTPLSLWYAARVSAQSGLLLGIATPR